MQATQVTKQSFLDKTFKLKENAELEVKGKYTQLNTEGYGGMICSTWFDKPLSIAGRLLIKDGNDIYIYDYKTNKEIKKRSYYDQTK